MRLFYGQAATAAALAVLMLGALARAAGADASPTPAAPRDSALTLAWVERMVLERNPTLQAARAAWHESQARAEQVGALEDPMLDVMVGPASFGSSAVDPAWRVGVSQKFPLFGQRGLARRAAGAGARAFGYDLEATRLDLLRAARDGYYEYFRVARSQETNVEIAALMTELRHVALARYAAGTAGQPDPLQAGVEVAMLEHEAVVLARQRRIVAAGLKSLMHLPQDTALSAPPRDLPLPEMPTSAAWLTARTGRAWPELGAAEARVAAGRAQLDLARRSRLPEWTVGAAYDRFWSEPELRTSVGLSMNLPLNAGRLSAAQREAHAALEAAEAERRAVLDRHDLAIETAAATLGESLHEVEIMREDVVPASERTMRALRGAYESNHADFVALLNAARDLTRARLGTYEAVARAHQAGAELARALAIEAPPPGQDGQP